MNDTVRPSEEVLRQQLLDLTAPIQKAMFEADDPLALMSLSTSILLTIGYNTVQVLDQLYGLEKNILDVFAFVLSQSANITPENVSMQETIDRAKKRGY
jgi:hypothetical protein